MAPFRHGIVEGLHCRGFHFATKEPFKNQLPEALVWFNALIFEAESRTRQQLRAADPAVHRFLTIARAAREASASARQLSLPPCQTVASACQEAVTAPQAATAAWLPIPPLADLRLWELCPACFGRRDWGGDPEVNPDVHVAVDGNFTHQHYASVENDPEIVPYQNQAIWLTDTELEAARLHITEAHEMHPAANLPTYQKDPLMNAKSLIRLQEIVGTRLWKVLWHPKDLWLWCVGTMCHYLSVILLPPVSNDFI
ncbi:hypothetical protein M422DRAFT_247573 [Sphaerobolus stellatus SS14]|nr:hypothetical protein M422DRAFT_247573 [Sphaerobolus stellatus SS14]